MTHRAAARLALAVATAAARTAAAHDFWIEPSSYRPAVASDLAVRLRVGQNFTGDAVPCDPASIERFLILGPRGETPIELRRGAEPAGVVRLGEPGLHVIGYRSLPSPISLAAEAFEAYLREEGLEAIITARQEAGDGAKRGREVFSRCAKALVRVAGGAPPRSHDLRLGFRLELVPQRDPYVLAPGHALPVQLLFDGKPLAGALVVAMNQDGPEQTLRARSDANGRVRFVLAQAGPWLVKAVHMVPAATPQADWESLWASLTFELPARRGAGAP